MERRLDIALADRPKISGLLEDIASPRACYVMAHGAGAGMAHPFLASVSANLATRRIASLRYQFPYMEARTGRPDPPPVAHAAVRAAVAEAARLLPQLPLFAGGKSFGGRMTSQAQAESLLPNVRGLIFLGFPLHAPGKPSDARAQHLSDVKIPMLFLQGDRDEFAQLDLLQPLIDRLGSRATLHLFPGANHSFHAPKKTGRTDTETLVEIAALIETWIDRVLKN